MIIQYFKQNLPQCCPFIMSAVKYLIKVIHYTSEDMTDSIKIAVRVRPFNDKEINEGSKNIIEMEGQEVRLRNPDGGEIKKFGFHRCYYSTDDAMGSPPVNNKFLFEDIGKEILNHIYQGYSSTVFAYGQTGSGKSYSIEGYEQKGILQMCLEDIFQRRKVENSKNGLATSVRITYLEIYNEKLRDLVNPSDDREIKVQQAGTAIFIQGVDPVLCESYEEVQRIFKDGKKIRVIGAHAMNKNSSRSHAVFTIYYKETGGGKMIDSKFNIVDLAGSERQSKTGATGVRLQEANSINKSLTNLGLVIEALALNCQKKTTNFVPYRNSMLTHILSESLCGNSKTFMIAAISPADSNYEQTLSTLRFAQRASMITTNSKKNVQAKQGYNKELLEQIQRLKKELQGAKGQVIHTHSVSVEYITIERQAEELDSRITEMMQELDHKKSEKESLQFKLHELEQEKKNLDIERSKQPKSILDPEKEKRAKELADEIANMREQIEKTKKDRADLEKELSQQKKKREELEKNIKQVLGQSTEEQRKAAELNARIILMMQELDKNKTDKQTLEKELIEEKLKKEEMERNRKKMLEEAGISGEQSSVNDRKYPYIMNVSEDPTLLGMLLYDLKEGETRIGTKQAEENQIKLNALGIMTRHCSIVHQKGRIYIVPNPQAKIFVNGTITTQKVQLNHLDRITLGHANNFKLIIPGKGTMDDLRQSFVGGGKYGEYIDDKLSTGTIEAKSMKTFLSELEHRLQKHLFAKFLEKFKNFFEDVDEANQYTFHRYKKFPLKSKNLHFRINAVIDIENYMKGVPELIILCEHKQTKEVLFVWTEQKFQNRLADMQTWYADVNRSSENQATYYEFDPWFDATDTFIKEKESIENLKTKELVQFWNKKQTDNADNYKKILVEQKQILAELKNMSYSETLVEDYADFYFRGFPISEKNKKKIEDMRKIEKVHKIIQRFMECCAQVQKCNMDNKFYNQQKEKYSNKKVGASNIQGGGASNDGMAQENVWLNQKIEQLQDELKRRTQIINKLKKGS